jgi:uncharacterized protein (DUF427 family)
MPPFPRRVRAEVAGEVVLDSERGRLLHETGILPRLYVPFEDVRQDLLERTETTTHCPFKGDASYWSVRAGGRVVADAFWAYEQPRAEAAWLEGLVAPYPERMDRWFDEDEEIGGHLRDPYHRVDARRSSRVVVVRAGGRVIAETSRPLVVSETGLPNRVYVPLRDVERAVLEPTATETQCPYKGVASWFRVRVDGGEAIENAAWSYEEPLEDAVKLAGHLAFDETKVDVDSQAS